MWGEVRKIILIPLIKLKFNENITIKEKPAKTKVTIPTAKPLLAFPFKILFHIIIIAIENPIVIKSPKINPTINIVLTPDVNEVWSYFVKLLKMTLLAVAKIIAKL
ncbi:hypothetical protein [Spiroplasma ixodetis]|uniref:Spiroplasmavirus-related protein n=1 Tax=Spiroplasma ixodetis TaxID=2141 RepID=A0ABN6SYY5_9MOLU|nr:hypothetical protein [Spiroplasma ixodetis]BDT03877.1 hypothetical protein SHM_15230 [Spiroplasma ixodetis]